MTDAAISAVGLKRWYGKTRAVDGTDLRVRRGEIYGLLGPNGAGKTTLIRIIAGLLKAEAGSVSVLGVAMPDKHIMARVGYMTQAVALYDELTVSENASFFASMCGVHDKKRIAEMIGFVGLSDRAGSKIYTLSGGMKRRASLACTLVHDPDVLLLDEPTVGVDPQLRASFWGHFRELADRGVSILLSSHVMDEASRCDRLGFMRAGRLIAEGTREDLLVTSGASDLEEAFLAFATGKDTV